MTFKYFFFVITLRDKVVRVGFDVRIARVLNILFHVFLQRKKKNTIIT